MCGSPLFLPQNNEEFTYVHDGYLTNYPTNPFTILKPQDQGIVKFYAVQNRRSTNFEAPKLWKGLSGSLQRIYSTTALALDLENIPSACTQLNISQFSNLKIRESQYFIKFKKVHWWILSLRIREMFGRAQTRSLHRPAKINSRPHFSQAMPFPSSYNVQLCFLSVNHLLRSRNFGCNLSTFANKYIFPTDPHTILRRKIRPSTFWNLIKFYFLDLKLWKGRSGSTHSLAPRIKMNFGSSWQAKDPAEASPTDLMTTFELPNPSIDKFWGSKWCKDRSGAGWLTGYIFANRTLLYPPTDFEKNPVIESADLADGYFYRFVESFCFPLSLRERKSRRAT